MRWQDIENEKEKYAAYLCSREWAEKKEAVRERAGGRCERCKAFDMDACHHVSYARKYNELLEDLAANCNFCHAFTHNKSDFDPIQYVRLIHHIRHVAQFGNGKRPVGFEFTFGLRSEIYCDAPVCAVYMLYQQHAIQSAATEAREVNIETIDEEARFIREWRECAELIQNEKLDVDLLDWLDRHEPRCSNFDHYRSIMKHFGFGPPNPNAEW